MLTSRKPTVATVRAGARASARKARWSAVAAPRVQRSPSRIAGASNRPAATAATKQTSAGSRMYRSRFPVSVPALAVPLLSPIAIATAAPIAATSTIRGPRPRRRPSGALTVTTIARVATTHTPTTIASPSTETSECRSTAPAGSPAASEIASTAITPTTRPRSTPASARVPTSDGRPRARPACAWLRAAPGGGLRSRPRAACRSQRRARIRAGAH